VGASDALLGEAIQLQAGCVSGRRAALHLECVLLLVSRSIAVSEGTEWNQRSLPNVALHSGSFMIGVVQLLNCFLIVSLVPPVIEGFTNHPNPLSAQATKNFSLAVYNTY
jgi:hypothetical protein